MIKVIIFIIALSVTCLIIVTILSMIVARSIGLPLKSLENLSIIVADGNQ